MFATSHRCVLLDRNGVINRRIVNGYVTRWKDFAFLPSVLVALRLLKENGCTVLVVSNQSCVGRGLLSRRELQAITRRMLWRWRWPAARSRKSITVATLRATNAVAAIRGPDF